MTADPTPTPEQPRLPRDQYGDPVQIGEQIIGRGAVTEVRWPIGICNGCGGRVVNVETEEGHGPHEAQARPEQDEAVRLLREKVLAYVHPHRVGEVLALVDALATPPPATPEQDQAVRAALNMLHWYASRDLHKPVEAVAVDGARDALLTRLATPPPATEADERYNMDFETPDEATPPPATPAAPCDDELCVLPRGHEGKHQTSVERVRITPVAARLATHAALDEAVRCPMCGAEAEPRYHGPSPSNSSMCQQGCPDEWQTRLPHLRWSCRRCGYAPMNWNTEPFATPPATCPVRCSTDAK